MIPHRFGDPHAVMRFALQLAVRGIGRVEPNPAVGAVLVDDALNLVAAGYHGEFGGPHAEIDVLAAAGPRTRGATLFVTLEPCCHHGKTPPCTQAVIEAGVRRVIVATPDPAPHADGAGIRELEDAGIDVEVGLCREDAERLIAPFRTLVTQGRPYVHAKWAMTLDGKVASRSGDSMWISNEASRRIVHALRGRSDAIVVGSGTARHDDPLLTARPPGPRTPTRVVLDSRASLPLSSKLAVTADEAPVLVACGSHARSQDAERLRQAGIEVLFASNETANAEGWFDVVWLLQELGSRGMTNVIVEGGPTVLGAFFDAGLIDEFHVFIAPKTLGGGAAPSALSGLGREKIRDASCIVPLQTRPLGGDIYVRGIPAR
jgi:diaminohydroxyphosphoribosylaminopyrimidine deaminase/5-amino-6-(5-phosphoribosylamino)uracil reductase